MLRLIAVLSIVIVLSSSSIYAATVSHPLSQITPIDQTLNLGTFGITAGTSTIGGVGLSGGNLTDVEYIVGGSPVQFIGDVIVPSGVFAANPTFTGNGSSVYTIWSLSSNTSNELARYGIFWSEDNYTAVEGTGTSGNTAKGHRFVIRTSPFNGSSFNGSKRFELPDFEIRGHDVRIPGSLFIGPTFNTSFLDKVHISGGSLRVDNGDIVVNSGYFRGDGSQLTNLPSGTGSNVSQLHAWNGSAWVGWKASASGVPSVDILSQAAQDLSCANCIGGVEIDESSLSGISAAAGWTDNSTSGAIHAANSSKNVGIGTTGPTSILHIKGGGAKVSVQTSTANSPNLLFYNSSGTELGGICGVTGSAQCGTSTLANDLSILVDNGGDIHFASDPGQANPTTRAIIKNSGNVGIGTASPQTKLHVHDGSIRFTDPDVAQPNTAAVPADTYGSIGILAGSVGGLQVNGWSDAGDADAALHLRGVSGANVFTNPVILLEAARTDTGTSYTTIANSQLLLAVRNSGNNKILVTGDGNLSIGSTSPSVALDVTGDIEYTGTITDVSDIRTKENIIQVDNALANISGIRGVYYSPVGSEDRNIGVIAQEVQLVLPEVVSVTNKEGHLGVDYTQLVPVLIEAVKELDLRVKALEKENSELRAKLSINQEAMK